MFFYFFESRRDPDKGVNGQLAPHLLNMTINVHLDDVMMWINGGKLKSKWRDGFVMLTLGEVPGVHLRWAFSWNSVIIYESLRRSDSIPYVSCILTQVRAEST
jgi:hypothetical protein